MSDPDPSYANSAPRILPHFGIPADAPLTLLAGGHNHVFRVDDGPRRFVLRFQSAGRLSDGAQRLQMEWLASLGPATGVNAPRPVPTLAGEWFVRAVVAAYQPPQRCVLLEWVEGEPLAPPGAFVDGDVLGRVGEVVARMHRHSAAFRSARDPDARPLDADDLVGWRSCMGDDGVAAAARPLIAAGDHAVLAAAASNVAAAMVAARAIDGKFGLIHADLGPANWVFHLGEPRPIDFDEFGRGFYLFDLLGVLWSHASWDQYPSFRDRLLAGYARVRPIPPHVARLADAFQAATLFAWLNHGCRLTDQAARQEFLKWVPSTTRTIARLCQV